MKKLSEIGLIIFMRCEELDGKIDILKAFNNFFQIYSDNLQIKTVILNEISFKGKKEFANALILLMRMFQTKIKSLITFFFNFFQNILITSKNISQVNFQFIFIKIIY